MYLLTSSVALSCFIFIWTYDSTGSSKKEVFRYKASRCMMYSILRVMQFLLLRKSIMTTILKISHWIFYLATFSASNCSHTISHRKVVLTTTLASMILKNTGIPSKTWSSEEMKWTLKESLELPWQTWQPSRIFLSNKYSSIVKRLHKSLSPILCNQQRTSKLRELRRPWL